MTHGIRNLSPTDLRLAYRKAILRCCWKTADACWRELLRRCEVKVDSRVELV
jgi:hypothetical protein